MIDEKWFEIQNFPFDIPSIRYRNMKLQIITMSHSTEIAQ